MDDITVVVAQVKTVVVPEDEVDLKNTHFYIKATLFHLFLYFFIDVNMCYFRFRVATQKNKRGMSRALQLWLHTK